MGILDKLVFSGDKEKSDLITSLEMLIDDKNIEGKTILKSNKQVNAITLMNWAGQVYDIPFLRDYSNRWTRYRISGNDGRGRNDIIKIAEAIRLEHEREHEKYKELVGMR